MALLRQIWSSGVKSETLHQVPSCSRLGKLYATAGSLIGGGLQRKLLIAQNRTPGHVTGSALYQHLQSVMFSYEKDGPWHRQIRDVEEVRRGRLSEEERALERDYDVEGTASGDDREGDDRWLPRHSPPQNSQVLSTSPHQVVHSCQRC